MDQGPRVISVNVSERKGTPKRPVPEIECREGLGVVGDAHAGTPGRQVSLLDRAEIRAFEAKHGIEVAPGAFAENITTQGLDLSRVEVGDEIRVGEVRLRVTQIGKPCHEGCAIREMVGDCIMPRVGVFAAVVAGGRIRPGDPVRLMKATRNA
ncbi:MOSC domain-containing protein [Candidatus Acetothermia bacterium]|nr:MAG: MOSC domain-containing protein [Candidatus Acetothermia bacterium]